MTPRTAVLLAMGLLLLPAPLPAQANLPPRGKIDAVERGARGTASDDTDDGDDGDDPWWVDIALDVLGAVFRTPKRPGQGYLPYPYAAPPPGARETFVLENVARRRRYGVLSFDRFSDASSTLRGTSIAFEGATAVLHYGLEYTRYREPKAGETDRLDSYRAALGVAARTGRAGVFRLAVALRAVCLDDGNCAGGGDFEMGLLLLPARPLGLSGTLRVGGVEWPGGPTVAVLETNAAVSLFVGRMEVRAGWHWLEFEGATAFAGPRLGARVWF